MIKGYDNPCGRLSHYFPFYANYYFYRGWDARVYCFYGWGNDYKSRVISSLLAKSIRSFNMHYIL